ncbi:MAG: 2-hydroxychromene-2-carboxylate isomerase [Proteobacteria bacterium]|nr:2-hydroxychromene-2-carboxylate isomerase [Pseudomonadota bacterium]
MTLDFYFDFVSPYAYVAWHKIYKVAARHGRTVKLHPVLFAAMLDHFGHKGPAEIPPKRLYLFKNVFRLAHAIGVVLEPPPAHPFNPLLALRVAGLDMPEDEQRRAVDALYSAAWAGGPGVTEPHAVAKTLTAAGLDGSTLVARAKESEAKARLRAVTDAAIARGVFGVPTVFAGEELFWGVDSFPHVDAFLAGRDPVPDDLITRWRHIPAQARRSSDSSRSDRNQH